MILRWLMTKSDKRELDAIMQELGSDWLVIESKLGSLNNSWHASIRKGDVVIRLLSFRGHCELTHVIDGKHVANPFLPERLSRAKIDEPAICAEAIKYMFDKPPLDHQYKRR